MHAFIVGMALLMAGTAALASPTDSEMEALRNEIEAARKKGRLSFFFYLPSNRPATWEKVIAHWPERPMGRKLIYGGAAFVAAAAAIGFSFGLFN